jgi:hypothetical protein
VRPKYKWPEQLAARGHEYQGKSGGHFHPFPRDGGAIYQKYRDGVSRQSLCWGALEKEDMPVEGMPDEQVAAWAVERLKQTDNLLPQREDPPARRIESAITTWHYKNHAARSLNFRYIRYRDGSEELYGHRTDPNEHCNLAGDPEYARIKEKLSGSMPKEYTVPRSMDDGGMDTLGRRAERLRSEGVAQWLGTEPSHSPVQENTK